MCNQFTNRFRPILSQRQLVKLCTGLKFIGTVECEKIPLSTKKSSINRVLVILHTTHERYKDGTLFSLGGLKRVLIHDIVCAVHVKFEFQKKTKKLHKLIINTTVYNASFDTQMSK